MRPGADRARHRRPPPGRRGGRPRPRPATATRRAGWSRPTQPDDLPGEGCELALVIGGDGSILRAAELTHETSTPLLGVNLGHVGFLAEAEHDDVESTIDAIVDRALHRRGPAHPRRARAAATGRWSSTTFALNEASVEKAARERMLEVVVEIDGRPLSRWGCDGVVCATPTGSTAYNFSAGGPVVWPEVEALLMVPISAHALFARPMVVAPTSVLAVEVLASTEGAGVLWCDGRRTVDLPPGARIEVRRGDRPVRLVRLHQAPFTDRLVAKFGLPVEGWRGAAERRRRDGGRRAATAMLEEIRISSLGVIDSSTLELGPGLTVITGETGAGKTMVVTALGLLLGGRADTGAVRTGRQAGAGRGRRRRPTSLAGFARGRRGRRAARSRTTGSCWPATSPPRAARAPSSAAPRCRCPRWPRSPSRWSPCTASPTSTGCCSRAPSATRSTGSAAPALAAAAGGVRRPLRPSSPRPSASSPRSSARARERAREADLLRFGLGEVEAVDPRPGEDAELAAEEARLGFADTLRTAAEQAREALSSEEGDARRAGAPPARPGTPLEGVREHDPEAGELADRLAELAYLLSDVAGRRGVVRLRPRDRPGPAGRRSPSAGRR